MEINYETIISYLSKNKSKNINNIPFITQKNINTYVKPPISNMCDNSNSVKLNELPDTCVFPEVFKNVLTENFFKYGITVNDNDNNNISFWSSIITILDKQFVFPLSYTHTEFEIINQFKTQLVDLYNPKVLCDFIKQYDKNDIKERFKLNPDCIVIQYIAEVLDINIIIFDFKDEKIKAVYPHDAMNPWKQSILLSNYDLFWEPVMCKKSKGTIIRLFDYNNPVFKKIINTNITYLNDTIIKKKFNFINNIQVVITNEKHLLKLDKDNNELFEHTIVEQDKAKIIIDTDNLNKLNTHNNVTVNISTINIEVTKNPSLEIPKVSIVDDQLSNNTDNLFIKLDEIENNKLTKAKMTKMKLEELNNLSKKFNIIVTKKNPTKAILIDLILAKIANC
jgi:hypothetical protein